MQLRECAERYAGRRALGFSPLWAWESILRRLRKQWDGRRCDGALARKRVENESHTAEFLVSDSGKEAALPAEERAAAVAARRAEAEARARRAEIEAKAAWARKEEVRDARARELKEERAARAARRGLSAAQASALASAEAEPQAMED